MRLSFYSNASVANLLRNLITLMFANEVFLKFILLLQTQIDQLQKKFKLECGNYSKHGVARLALVFLVLNACGFQFLLHDIGFSSSALWAVPKKI